MKIDKGVKNMLIVGHVSLLTIFKVIKFAIYNSSTMLDADSIYVHVVSALIIKTQCIP